MPKFLRPVLQDIRYISDKKVFSYDHFAAQY
jgi:hypothetical protein